MSTKFSKEQGNLVDMQKIADHAASILANAAGYIASMHPDVNKLYVIKTIHTGIGREIFTAPFAIFRRKGSPVFQQDRISDIGLLNPEVTIAEHIEETINMNPGTAIVLDQETAIKLGKDDSRSMTLIDYGNGHCLLTGLSPRGIDVYLAADVEDISKIAEFTYVRYSQEKG